MITAICIVIPVIRVVAEEIAIGVVLVFSFLVILIMRFIAIVTTVASGTGIRIKGIGCVETDFHDRVAAIAHDST